MSELSTPLSPGLPLGDDEHLLRPILDRAVRTPLHPLVAVRAGDTFADVPASEFVSRVRALARGLIGIGVGPGDRVALMSHTRLEWLLCDYAILAVGAATVPVYETSSVEQLHWILVDSGAKAVILETGEHAASYAGIADTVPDCTSSFVIDEGGLDRLRAAGEDVDESALDDRLDTLTVDSLATIIYTSGTTGRPKGCVLTHRNLRSNVRQVLAVAEPMLREGDRTLLFLPLAHSLAKIITLFAVEKGVTVGFATDMSAIVDELALFRPSFVVSVPRVFEKVYNSAQHKAQQEGKGAIFDRAAETAVAWSRADVDEGPASVGTRILHRIFDPLVYRKLRAVFGGELRFAVSGGGPLGARLTHFFHGMGVDVYEGYGLTETSPVTNVNVEQAWRIGTVGRPVPGTTIRISDAGEVLVAGPQVFGGYWHNEVATAEVFDTDGFFHTGDLGALDGDGFLEITGRAKDLIVTAAGKNVAPAPLEDRLRAHPLISQAMVVGDARPFVAALVAIDEEAFTLWAEGRDRPGAVLAEMTEDPALVAEIQQAIDEANALVSRAESIRRFVILPRDLSIEGGELTPTLKVKRNVLAKQYSHVIDVLYRGD